MKKHLVFAILFSIATTVVAQNQSLVHSGNQSATDALQFARQAAEQHFGVLNSGNNDYGRDHCDCHKCQYQKKSKHEECKGKGNHYGKHKNKRNQHGCSCDHHQCDNSGDRQYNGNGNGRSERNNDDRYGSTRHDRDNNSRPQSRTGQRTSTAKVKSRPAPTAKPTPTTQPVAKKKEKTRPAGTK